MAPRAIHHIWLLQRLLSACLVSITPFLSTRDELAIYTYFRFRMQSQSLLTSRNVKPPLAATSVSIYKLEMVDIWDVSDL